MALTQDVSGLAALWESAVVEYTKNTGKNLCMDRSRTMADVMRDTRQKLEAFEAYRHSNTKTDKVRSAFSRNLETIHKVLIGVNMVGNGAGLIFPPAMPASLLFSAFGYVLQSFSDVSADYDKVEIFFNTTHRYFDTLSILEDKMPKAAPFQRCVTRVFSCQLRICSISQGYAKEKRRFKKWFDALSNGADEDLTWAYSSMDSAIRELSQAIGFSTYQEIRETHEDVQNLSRQMEETKASAESFEQIALLARLPRANGAAFNAGSREFDLKCLPGTRVEILDQIRIWSDDPHSNCIFWLSGMVGTGKSTISRTVANIFAKQNRLAGSFFFTRGGGDLALTTKFFTTLAYQLAGELAPFKRALCETILKNPEIAGNYLSDQWQQLFFLPLNSMESSSLIPSTWIFVIDALDECEESHHKIGKVLELLAQAQNIKTVRLKFFITSRPEPSIRLSFSHISEAYQNFVLNEVPQSVVDRDIGVFIKHELDNIRVVRKLPTGWPGQEKLQNLVQRANGLFIYAWTVCRFILNRTRSATAQLEIVLRGTGRSHTDKLDEMYTQVLTHSVTGDSTGEEREELIKQFKQIVGSVVILFQPLSAAALAKLLQLENEEKEMMDMRLDELHSVLDVPEGQYSPIRLLHISFRDFLLDEQRRLGAQFRINKAQTHRDLAENCLRTMSNALTRDICGLRMPGTIIKDVDARKVQEYVPAELQYACQYWVWHLESSVKHSEKGVEYRFLDKVYTFLKDHLLNWFEVLSLLGKMYESIRMLSALSMLVQTSNHQLLFDFVHDAYRFSMSNCSIIAQAPLQAYCAALIFCPSKSKVRGHFERQIPSWVKLRPSVPANWDSLLQTLEGHSGLVWSAVISTDGQKIVSGSWDKTIRIWDIESGSLLQTLEGHPERVWSVAISTDGQTIVSGSQDAHVRIWDARLGSLLKTLEGHSERVWAVAISSDCRRIVSGSCDKTARVWDLESGSLLHTLEGHQGWVRSVAISRNCRKIVSGSWDKTLRVWDAKSGSLLHILEGHSGRIWSVAISSNGQKVCSAGWDETVRVWDAESGLPLLTLEGHSGPIEAVTISSDDQKILSGSWDKTVRVWDIATGSPLQTLKGHSGNIHCVAISSNGQKIVSGAADKTLRVWDAESVSLSQAAFESHSGPIWSIIISNDSQKIISGSGDTTIRVWDAESGSLLQLLEGHSGRVESITTSNDGKKILSGSDDKTVRIWDVTSGSLLQTLEHPSPVESVAISKDDQKIVSRSDDQIVRVWDAESGSLLQTAEDYSELIDSAAIARDSQLGELNVSDRWVTFCQKRVILLPENRRVHSLVARGSKVAIGSRSGIVTVLGLDLDELHRQICILAGDAQGTECECRQRKLLSISPP
ncbi:WD40-repeat-containing domain protein [Trichoderma camerunense]